MTVWIEPTVELARRMSLPAVPLPVSESTSEQLSVGRVEAAAIALDVDAWLAAGLGTAVQRRVLARYVASLAYVAAVELLDVGLASPAAKIAEIGVRHADDDPSLRTLLGLARWDCGHRVDAVAHLVTAVDQYAAAGQVAPMLNILTARALADSGRHGLANGLVEVLASSEPRVPLFWDLVDALERRAAVAAGG